MAQHEHAVLPVAADARCPRCGSDIQRGEDALHWQTDGHAFLRAAPDGAAWRVGACLKCAAVHVPGACQLCSC